MGPFLISNSLTPLSQSFHALFLPLPNYTSFQSSQWWGRSGTSFGCRIVFRTYSSSSLLFFFFLNKHTVTIDNQPESLESFFFIFHPLLEEEDQLEGVSPDQQLPVLHCREQLSLSSGYCCWVWIQQQTSNTTRKIDQSQRGLMTSFPLFFFLYCFGFPRGRDRR